MKWQCRQTAETLASRMRADRELYREVTTCRDRITSAAVRPRGNTGEVRERLSLCSAPHGQRFCVSRVCYSSCT